MKIFVVGSNPTAHSYYEILQFLFDHATRKEIDFYLDQIEVEKKNEEE